jgi:uracil-DNA glycosylase family 4
MDAWDVHDQKVINCRACPRLVAWREQVARDKRRAYRDWEYWGKPVPGFGDHQAKVLIIGLAPGAHGSNRTGRMFTGDASGDFMYPALQAAGFANQGKATDRKDGLELKNVFISAVCRCAPPDNKPTREEIRNCLPYLLTEMDLLTNLQGIVALGSLAFHESLGLLQTLYGLKLNTKPAFAHSQLYEFEDGIPWLLASYHPSRQNTQTGRLTTAMFAEVWERVSGLIA